MEMKKQDGIELIDRIASHKNIWAAYKKVKSNVRIYERLEYIKRVSMNR